LTKLGELAVPALMSSLRDDYIANFAIHAIMGIGEPALLPLIDALKDTDSGVRSWVVIALSALSDRRTVEPLIDILKDEDTSVRQFAAEALGKIGDERSIPALRWLQQHDSYIQVKNAATEAIARIEGST
jgi:HEAT repeat protein